MAAASSAWIVSDAPTPATMRPRERGCGGTELIEGAVMLLSG
jgi:hypothetical protein